MGKASRRKKERQVADNHLERLLKRWGELLHLKKALRQAGYQDIDYHEAVSELKLAIEYLYHQVVVKERICPHTQMIEASTSFLRSFQ